MSVGAGWPQAPILRRVQVRSDRGIYFYQFRAADGRPNEPPRWWNGHIPLDVERAALIEEIWRSRYESGRTQRR